MVIAADREKIDWPPLSDLQAMVEAKGYEPTGRHLGVSGNTVKKHIQRHHAAERRMVGQTGVEPVSPDFQPGA